MKILVVHNRDISAFPPVRSLIQNLVHNGHKVTIITRDSKDVLKEYGDQLEVHKLMPYQGGNKVKEAGAFFKNRRDIRQLVAECMNHNDVIWTTTDSTVREIGPMLFNYKHIMELFELIEYLPLLPKQNVLKFDIKKYAQHAYKVVVPEINRAYIQQVWWDLPKTPVVLPNKPYDISLNSIHVSPDLKAILENMENEKRKIVLYQGVFYADRNLDAFAEAIQQNNEKYVLYIMGAENDYSRTLCRKYPGMKYIPFQVPPAHLLVTKYADIGVIPYKPVKFENNSILNALYCAPNKIFEYAAFGLPMVGSNVLGLKLPFEQYNIGFCCDELKYDQISHALDVIEAHYNEMSSNCINFYKSIDLDQIVNSILLED